MSTQTAEPGRIRRDSAHLSVPPLPQKDLSCVTPEGCGEVPIWLWWMSWDRRPSPLYLDGRVERSVVDEDIGPDVPQSVPSGLQDEPPDHHVINDDLEEFKSEFQVRRIPLSSFEQSLIKGEPLVPFIVQGPGPHRTHERRDCPGSMCGRQLSGPGRDHRLFRGPSSSTPSPCDRSLLPWPPNRDPHRATRLWTFPFFPSTTRSFDPPSVPPPVVQEQ